MLTGQAVADWRRAEDYTLLAQCDRHGFAWEWLRRLPDYQAACAGSDFTHSALRFGLHRLEPFGHGRPMARPIWSKKANPSVLIGMARPGLHDAFNVSSLASMATCVVGARGREHWLFSDGWRQVRLDIVAGTLTEGAVALSFFICGMRRAEPGLPSLKQLVALVRTGRLQPSHFPPEQRAVRWALILRTHDALMAGATHRQIAEYLFDVREPRWRINAPSWRSRVQRLTEAARQAANIDPRRWLQGSFP